jgi:hypothetical protein
MAKWIRAAVVISVGLLIAGSGCGGGKENPRPSADEQANAKVAAIKRLADELAKDPNGAEARGALEEFRNTPFDAQKNPQQAEEIAQVYRERIQGKYKGFVVQELQGEMGQFLTRPKQGK